MQLFEVFKDSEGKIISYKPVFSDGTLALFNKVSELRRDMKNNPEDYQDAIGGKRYFTLHEEKPILSIKEDKLITIVEE